MSRKERIKKYKSFLSIGFLILFAAGGIWGASKYHALPSPSPSVHKVVHISFDDVVMVLKELRDHADEYESIFDCRFFKDLKDLQDSYGAKFTLFIFEETSDFTIVEIPRKFKNEFKANASWLRFGFHAKAPDSSRDLAPYDFLSSFCRVRSAIEEFADSSSVSSVLRLDYYYATDSMVTEMNRTGYVTGLLCADDERVSYNLTPQENKLLQQCFFIQKDVKYFKTDVRYENVWSVDYSLALLQNRDTLVLFTHEWAYLPQTPLQWMSRHLITPSLQANWRTRQKVRESIKWLQEHKYKFDFLE